MNRVKSFLNDTSLFRKIYIIDLFLCMVSYVQLLGYVMLPFLFIWGLRMVYFNQHRYNTFFKMRFGIWVGAFIAASAESYKGKLRDLLAWYRHQMEALGVEIHLGYEVRTLQEFGDEPVIVATGAVPRVLKGVTGHEKMIEACEFLLSEPGAAEAAGLCSGDTGADGMAPGVRAAGRALNIGNTVALQGKRPVIIEMLDDLIRQKGVCLANSSYLREYFAWKKVPVYLKTRLVEVKDGAVVCTDEDGKLFEIPCDSVISCAGYLPAPLSPAGKKNVQIIGDCRSVGNLRSVIWGAYEAAMKV